MEVEPAAFWDDVWASREAPETSWFQSSPEPCLAQVTALTEPGDHVVIVGAGRTPLAGALAERDRRVTVLDVSAVAIERLMASLAEVGLDHGVTGVVADVRHPPPLEPAALWHDRATLHFITESSGQRAYVDAAADVVVPGGSLVVVGFGPNGPEQCSGLDVVRHSEESLTELLAPDFEVLEANEEVHRTPWDSKQVFLRVLARRAS